MSPVVPILKSTGDLRLCVDMKGVNEPIVRERFSLPVLEEILPLLKDCKFFSTLDLESAYHQIELDEKSRPITTFVTSSGLYRFKL